MIVHRSASVEGFLSEVGEFLALREAEHNLLFGICSSLAAGELELENDAPYMAYVEDEGRIMAAAVRTPPHSLVLSLVDEPTVLQLIAADAKNVYGRFAGSAWPQGSRSPVRNRLGETHRTEGALAEARTNLSV